jgi:putative membrane protein
MYGYGFEPFHIFGSVISVLFWFLFIVFILKLIKRGKRGHWEGWGEHKTAIGLLRERFAKGEISKEEYEEKKKVLEQK